MAVSESKRIVLPDRTAVMGVMNMTPDSFYDGGKLPDAEAAHMAALAHIADGADLLDVGGESSRPGAEPVAPDEELRRVLPVVEALAELDVAISIDTYRASTARAALDAGAALVNDITALRGDPEMALVVAEVGCACVLMHMQGTPQTMQKAPTYQNVVDDICAFFEERIQFALSHGIAEEHIWLDPGFGFGKTPSQNLEILRRFAEFKRFGRPLLVGTSNKSTIGKVLGTTVDDRTEGTAATIAVAIMNGADVVRVHDVRVMARVARMTDAILGRIEVD